MLGFPRSTTKFTAGLQTLWDVTEVDNTSALFRALILPVGILHRLDFTFTLPSDICTTEFVPTSCNRKIYTRQ